MSHAHCPHCQKALSDWTFPLPQEGAVDVGGQSPNVLGVHKQGKVTVVRCGVNRILDELTIKRFGDELFRAADRPDCRNLLLDFEGVVGLSSAMLGVLLLLRRKVGEKQGSVKLCRVGPEIMDVFHATKLGQLFDILDEEEDGVRAFK